MANEEKMTENAVSKAMKPSLATLNRIESGIAKLGAAAAGGAEARVEEARAKKKSDDREEKANTLLEAMVKGISNLSKSMASKAAAGAIKGIGISLATVTAPIVMMASFFKQLKMEFAVLKSLTGGGLKKLFAPLKKILKGEGTLGKAIKGALKFIDKMHGGIFTKIGNFFKGFKNNKTIIKISETITKTKESFAKGMAKLKKLFEPISKFFKGVAKGGKTATRFSKIATKIMSFAKGFGSVLGKLFLPITIVMSAFDFITGFMKGYKEDGIMKGLEEGTSKLLQGLIGMPLDLLKDGVSWILKKFGFEQASETLDAFSFSKLIDKMVGGFFDTVDGVIGWLGDTFKFGSISEALTSMLKAIWLPAILFREWLIDPIVDWLGKKFKFDTTAFKEFSVFDHIEKMLSDIGKFFKGLFDIDWDSAIKNLAPNWVKKVPIVGKWFGGGDDKPDNDAVPDDKPDTANAGKGGAGEVIKAPRVKNVRLEENERQIANTKSHLATQNAKLASGKGNKKTIAIRANLIEQLKGLQDVNKSIKSEQGDGEVSNNLSSSDKNKLKEALGKRESGGKYDVLNSLGFSGKYQFGDMALEDMGLLKSGASKLGSVAKVTGDPNNWNLKGGLSAWLSTGGLQESSMDKLMSNNLRVLKGAPGFKQFKRGDIAGALAAAHLVGAGGAKKFLAGNDSADAYGTKASDYFALGKNVIEAKEGFHGVVKKEIWFRTGEAGAERVDITPMRDPADTTNVLNSLHTENAQGKMGGGNAPTVVSAPQSTVNNSSSSTVVAEAPRARKNLPLGQS